ncbi:MAG: single-stranded DNA-binding protein [Bdellovibrionales bacterium]|nr:single-stranded DNA-binding protein [Bdellovibrionales bacterium]
MSGVNKVIIVGRLGGDPESRQTSTGQAVTRFNVATSEQWKDKNSGQMQERTEWHRVVVWGRLGEICDKHLSKGRQVYLEGRLQTRSWEDPQGQKKYSTEVIANTVQFLGSAGERTTSSSNDNSGYDFAQEPSFDADEEIPF